MKHSENLQVYRIGNQFFTMYGPFRCSSWWATIIGAVALLIGVGLIIVMGGVF